MLNDIDPNDFTRSAEQRMDEQLYVKFYHKERQDKTKSLEAGRPIFKEVEYIEIRIPGERAPKACRPATYQDKQRFPRHYAAFQQRVELPEEGTPLSEWPVVTRSQVEELAYLSVKTVEALASISDTNLSGFMGGNGLKRRAAEWLEQSSATALIEEKEKMQAELDELKAQMAELLASKSGEAKSKDIVLDTEQEQEQEQEPEPEMVKTKKRVRKTKTD